MKRVVAWVVTLFGAGLMFVGARSVFDANHGQQVAARSWSRAVDRDRPPRPGEVIARLTIPRFNTTYFVVEGTNPAQLAVGPGHVEGAALPGASGNCVITGHRDTHFRMLRNIRPGDTVILDNGRKRFRYRITKHAIVGPRDTWVLNATSQPTLTLITCYPFTYIGSAPDRFVIRAELM